MEFVERRCVIACALAAVLIARPAWGGDAVAPASDAAAPAVIPDPLSLDQAVELFRAHGFDLLLGDAAVAGARGDLVSASALPNPVVSGAGGTAFNYDPDRCGSSGCSATRSMSAPPIRGCWWIWWSARRRAGRLAGKTPHFKTVVFPADGAAPGDLVRVRVAGTTAHTLIGQ